MATSPNFNWPEPDNTDLVKNGALAIRTAVDAIDTSLVDLKGGTTGQVLSKASNTDMDFVWAADAGAPTSYGFSAGKNKIINGDMGIWQRGTSFTVTSAANQWSADRFFTGTSITTTITQQTFTPASAPVAGYEGTYFMQLAVAANSGASDYSITEQRMEDVRVFAGQTITYSFWAKATSGTPKIALELTQHFGTGGSASISTPAGAVTISTSWARYTITVAVPSVSGKTIGSSSYLTTQLWFTAGSTYNTRASSIGNQTNTFSLWGVQVEAGSTATAFQTATGTIQGELAACQRYYWRRTGENNAQDWFSTFGTAYSTTNATVYFQCPQTMRVKPSAVDYANLMIFRVDNGAQIAVTSLAFNNNNPDMTELIAVGGAFLVNFAVVQIKGDGSGVPFIGFSAEL